MSVKVTYCFFEPHEGKNLSDTIGSICKNSWQRTMFDNRDGIQSAEELVDRMKSGLNTSTKKFEHFIVIAHPPIHHLPKENLGSIAMPGIMKNISLFRTINGTIRGNTVACMNCTTSNRYSKFEAQLQTSNNKEN